MRKPARKARTSGLVAKACAEDVMICINTNRRWCSRRSAGRINRVIKPSAAVSGVRGPPLRFFAKYSAASKWSARRSSVPFPWPVVSKCFVPFDVWPPCRDRNVPTPLRAQILQRA